jgi:hypothetical protein
MATYQIIQESTNFTDTIIKRFQGKGLLLVWVHLKKLKNQDSLEVR